MFIFISYDGIVLVVVGREVFFVLVDCMDYV